MSSLADVALADLALDRRIGALLAPWAEAASGPGVTVGVARAGVLVAHRSAGLASIELGVKIGPETCFRIASVSKQFTCAAILLLAQAGRLSPGDDARRHLPELPDLGATITVAHLMHNTSGIRDMLEIMRMGGADLGQVVTSEDLFAGICRQRGLNFQPGSRYLYSNSNFFLLGLIVERLSGESLPAFLRRRIFGPLGMTLTSLTPEIDAPVKGLATGYIPGPEGAWRRARHGFPVGGEGGLISCVTDLALWDRNFETHEVGGRALAASLAEHAPFSNGEPNTYARGLQLSAHRGLRTISHGGLWPGYKTQFLRAPTVRTAVIVISNDATSDPWHLAHDVLEAAVAGRARLHPAPALPPAEALARFAGRWIDVARGATVDIRIDEHGVPIGSTHGVPFRLRALGDGRLIASRPARDFVARLAADGESLEVEADAGTVTTFTRAPETAVLPEGLAGRYVNAEMAAAWTLADGPEGMTLVVSGPLVTARGWRVVPVAGDLIRVLAPRALFESWLDTVVVRTDGGQITGLRADGGRARGVVFVREG
jgi:CubicO group peptidase (beta-lactamase class C family)